MIMNTGISIYSWLQFVDYPVPSLMCNACVQKILNDKIIFNNCTKIVFSESFQTLFDLLILIEKSVPKLILIQTTINRILNSMQANYSLSWENFLLTTHSSSFA